MAQNGAQNGNGNPAAHQPGWRRFFGMIATAIVTMLILTYANSWATDHLFFSQTRMWMALMMGMAMIGIMLGFMWGIYPSTTAKITLLSLAAAGFVLFLFLVRSQRTIGDEAWMKAMIPHHSIAVLTSARAEISDPRVRRLADQIIEAQVREIAEMRLLLADIEAHGEMGSGAPLPARTTKLTPAMHEEAVQAVTRPGER